MKFSLCCREKKLTKLLKEIVALLTSIDDRLRREFAPKTPGALLVTFTGEDAMNIVYDVLLPALSVPNDVASRELTVVIDGGTPSVHTASPTDSRIAGLSAPQGATVNLSLTDIDDAGNRSVNASTLTFVAADTIPPADPGALGVEVTGETA